MKVLPVALVVEGKRVLVVGGGAVASRKVAALLEGGALVSVVSPERAPGFPAPVEHIARRFEPNDCAGFSLVFAATDSREVNAQVAQEAREIGIPLNDASDPDGSDFHTQAVVRRGPLTIGISTEGDSPVVSGHLRREIETLIGPEWELLFALMRETRAASRFPSGGRGALWKAILNGPILDLLREGKRDEAKRELEATLGH